MNYNKYINALIGLIILIVVTVVIFMGVCALDEMVRSLL